MKANGAIINIKVKGNRVETIPMDDVQISLPGSGLIPPFGVCPHLDIDRMSDRELMEKGSIYTAHTEAFSLLTVLLCKECADSLVKPEHKNFSVGTE